MVKNVWTQFQLLLLVSLLEPLVAVSVPSVMDDWTASPTIFPNELLVIPNKSCGNGTRYGNPYDTCHKSIFLP